MATDIIAIEAEILGKLRALEGKMWAEAQGELQEDDGECALWILLFEDSDPAESHRALCDILIPHIEAIKPVQFTVSYTILTDIFDISVDTLMDSAEIVAACDDPKFAKRTMARARGGMSVFRAKQSGNRPA